MHTSRDEPDCQLDESCSKWNAAALRTDELVWDTYHVACTLHREVLDMKTPHWPPSDVSVPEKSVNVPNLLYNFLAWLVWRCASSNFCSLASSNFCSLAACPSPTDWGPSVNDHGWSIGSDNSIIINWITQVPAPQQLLELVSCSCIKECGKARCSCHSNSIQCTDVCQCVDLFIVCRRRKVGW